MERLILLRHGEAEREAVSGDDFDRALTDRGRADSAASGRMLAVSGGAPDLALVSSAVRTVQTFEAMRDLFPRAAGQTSRALYLAAPREILEAVQAAAGDARTVLVVGHNPGLHDLALAMAREGAAPPPQLAKLEQGFPPAAAAVFEMAAGRPRLAAVHWPKGSQR